MTEDEYYKLFPKDDDICPCWTGNGIWYGDKCRRCGCNEYQSTSKAVAKGYVTWESVRASAE